MNYSCDHKGEVFYIDSCQSVCFVCLSVFCLNLISFCTNGCIPLSLSVCLSPCMFCNELCCLSQIGVISILEYNYWALECSLLSLLLMGTHFS